MQIANLEFNKYPVFLSPMEDVTDPAFRLMCRRFGADMVYTEFVSASSLVKNIANTYRKLTICEEERPVAIQIYGNDVDEMVQAAIIAEKENPDIIDINFGCPVKKIAKRGAGSGMFRDIPKMLEITREVVKAVNIPVSVKTRLGWDDDSKCIVDVAERLQDEGIVALAIHGRTREQMYSGEADWQLIGEVKQNPRMTIPIIGNGDITTPEKAKRAFDVYGVDAIMIGRGCIGAPWIFRDVKQCLAGEEVCPLSFSEKLDVIKLQITNNVEWLGEMKGILHTRRHLAKSPLFDELPDFREMRIELLQAKLKVDLDLLIDNIADKYSK